MEANKADLSSLRIDRSKKNVNPELKGRNVRFTIYTLIVIIIIAALYFGWKNLTTPEVEVKLQRLFYNLMLKAMPYSLQAAMLLHKEKRQ
ncbi:MAG: hypothetical protein IPK06_06250 [Ignavibacteriae bacterium]|nr:hypothetical protein [Ignavibacteriota bacterium]